MSTRAMSIFSSFFEWLHDSLSGAQDRGSERRRLAQLAAHNQMLQKQAEDSRAKAMKRPAMTDQDRDNYLRGELISANHDSFEKHNHETVSHWLHPEDDAIKKPVAPSLSPKPTPTRATGNFDYEIKETRLLEFTDIGLGMDRDCLSSFIGHQSSKVEPPEEHPPRSTRELMMMRRTVKDMPALKPTSAKEWSFRPLDEANHKKTG